MAVNVLSFRFCDVQVLFSDCVLYVGCWFGGVEGEAGYSGWWFGCGFAV